MDNLEKVIQQINDRINMIDGKLDELEQKRQDNKDKVELGVISVLKDGNLFLELLMDEKWFDEKDMEDLEKAVGDIQKVLLRIQNKIEEEGK